LSSSGLSAAEIAAIVGYVVFVGIVDVVVLLVRHRKQAHLGKWPPLGEAVSLPPSLLLFP
jgi:hypothetical protein